MGSKEAPNVKPPSKAIEEEFLASYDEYSDALFRHAYLRVRDRDLAKDVVQEAFSKTWLYLAERKKIGHMRAFLYRVVNNLIVDAMRKKRSSSLDSMMEDDGFEPTDESAETEKSHAIREEAKDAMKLLGNLDEIYRTAITMRFVDELSPKEIATTLGVSENVVSVRIHRGIQKLNELLKEHQAQAL